ncbi:hypothetical protein AB1N83_010043 [Pleurotus pulmonarius]
MIASSGRPHPTFLLTFTALPHSTIVRSLSVQHPTVPQSTAILLFWLTIEGIRFMRPNVNLPILTLRTAAMS